MQEELEWRKIENTDHSVSNTGLIRNDKRGRIRKLTPLYTGYLIVRLKGKNEYVHRIVAKTFISNPDNKPEVNHKNLIKSDCSVSNLEWATPKENMQHAKINGRVKSPSKGNFGINSVRLKHTVIQLSLDGFLIGVYNGTHEAQRETGVSYQNILHCFYGNQKTAGGYRWVS